jgi:hypothetical protein
VQLLLQPAFCKSNVTLARYISTLACQVETGQVNKLAWGELKQKGGTVLEHKYGARRSQYEPDKKSHCLHCQ